MQEVAENSITLVSDRDGMLPLKLDKDDFVLTVKLSRLVQVQESDVGVPWVAKQIATRFSCKLSILDENTKIEEGYRCVVFTENAHLSNWQKQLLFQVRKNFNKVLGRSSKSVRLQFDRIFEHLHLWLRNGLAESSFESVAR